MLAALEERLFRVFSRHAGLEEHFKDMELIPENYPMFKAIIAGYFSSRSTGDLAPMFAQKDICLTLIRNLDEVTSDPCFKERGMIFSISHPRFGEILQMGSPLKLSGAGPADRVPPPELGQHNEEIYGALGYSVSDLETLKRGRII